MFTRAVELTAKPGKMKELFSLVSEKVRSVMNKQQGFQDEIMLISHTDPNRALILSFWNSREDAECYQREDFVRIAEMLRPVCENEPVFFDVNPALVKGELKRADYPLY